MDQEVGSLFNNDKYIYLACSYNRAFQPVTLDDVVKSKVGTSICRDLWNYFDICSKHISIKTYGLPIRVRVSFYANNIAKNIFYLLNEAFEECPSLVIHIGFATEDGGRMEQQLHAPYLSFPICTNHYDYKKLGEGLESYKLDGDELLFHSKINNPLYFVPDIWACRTDVISCTYDIQCRNPKHTISYIPPFSDERLNKYHYMWLDTPVDEKESRLKGVSVIRYQ